MLRHNPNMEMPNLVRLENIKKKKSQKSIELWWMEAIQEAMWFEQRT